MLKLANRVKETSISTGTGSVILRGGFGAFQTFSSAIGNANSTFYTIENETRWEVGIGTYTSATNSLSRDTVLSSSNGGSKIDLNGVSIVFCTLPAEKTVFFGDNNYLPEGKPLTLTRESAGNFIHAFVDNSSDETVALHMQDSSDPTWKFGLKNTPNSKTTAPQYGYVYGSNGTAGLYGDSDAYAYMDSNLGFYIVHESSNLVQVTKDGGTEIKNGSANVNALTVKGAAAQSYPLQVWTNNAGTTLSSVSSDGSLALGKSGGANYTLDVDGTANVTTLRFSDGSSQTTASKPSGEFVGLSGVVETNKTNVATNTAQIAINKATTVDVSGLLTGPYSAASGTLINTHFMPLVSGQVVMPISSGDVINTMLAAIDQGGGGGGDGLPTSSGALINTHFLPKSSGNAIYLPTSSGANIAANFMPLFSGIAINTFFATKQDEITASNRIDSAHIAGGNVSNTEFGFLNGVTDDIQTQLDGKIPTSSGAAINAHFMPMVSGDAKYIPISSGAAINAHFMPMVSGDVKYLPVASGDVINDAFVDIVDSATPSAGSGLLKIGNTFHAVSGSIITSGVVMLTNDVSSNLTPSGKAVTPQGVINYAIPATSGDVINTALVNVLGGSIPKDSGYLPIESGVVINDAFVDIVNSVSPPSAGSGLIKIGNTFHGASGSIITSGVVRLTNDVTSNPTPSGLAVTPQGVINYAIPVTSGAAINATFVDIVDGAMPASSGHDVLHSVGLGLLKSGGHVYAASGSIVASGSLMLTNDVASNPTPSGKAVTPQGVINYVDALTLDEDNMASDSATSLATQQSIKAYVDANAGSVTVGLGLSKVGSNVFGASGSLVTSGVVMLTNDVSSNPTPSGKAVTPQGVINYALPATSGDTINTMLAAASVVNASGSLTTYALPVTSGAVINDAFVDIVDGAMPASSGHDVLHSVGLGLTKSGGHVHAASGSIVASGSVMLTNDVASNPTPSGKAVTPQGVINYVDGLILDEDNFASDSATSLATQQSIKAYVDANAGTVTVGLGLSKVGSNVFGASGSLVTSGVVMLTNDVTSNPTPSGKAVTPQGVINYAMPASSGHDVLHSVGLGLTKSGGHVHAASGSIVASGALMLTNDVAANLSPSGKAVTTQGVINYALPATSGDVINTMLAAASVVNASGSLFTYAAPSSIHLIAGDGLTGGGNISANRTFAVNVDDSTIETNSDEIRVKDAGITLAKMANLANMKVIGNTTGGAATPAAVSILDEDNMASDSATSLATQQSIKAYVDANAGSVTVGLGLSKVGSNVFGASGSLVTSGVVMLTNDVSSNPTPSGKAVTPQGVINYAMPASSGHDVLHSVGLGLTKSGGHVHAASGSIVASGSVMLTNDVSSNPTPSGKAVTPQGVINYALPATSGDTINTMLAAASVANASGSLITYAAPSSIHLIAGDGLTGGGNISANRTFTVVGGDGITANANDIAITAAQTTITSIYNSSLAIGYGASHANINFGTDNQITFDIDGAGQVVLKDGIFHPVTDSDVDLGKFDKTWKDAYLDTIQTTSDIICSGEIRTSGIAYLDNDYAMSIADGGAVTFKKAVHYPVVENTQSSATLALDLATGNHFQVNLGANVTAINLANSTLGQRFIIRFTQDGTGSRTVVWNDVDSPDATNAYIAWAGGSAPTLTTTAGKSDTLGFICTSGTQYFDGYVIGQGM